MSRFKFVLVLALLLLISVPATILAQTPEPISAQTPEGTGTAIIFDDQSLGDGIVLAMTGVSAPAAGKEYVGWLISDDGKKELNIGTMTLGGDGTLSHTFDNSSSRYAADNLINLYDTAVVTVEDAGFDEDASIGPAVFFHVIPEVTVTHIRNLLASWPSGEARGILTNLNEQLDLAIAQAALAENSATLEAMQQHAHQVVNIIEGAEGSNYDSSFGDPGNGIGVLAHVADRKHGGLAASAAADDTVVNAHADLLEVIGTNVETWATGARDAALEVIGAADLALAKIHIGPGAKTVTSLLSAARNGHDANGDGTVGYVANEGGATQVYRQAQLMATFTLVPGAPPVPPTPTPVPPTPTPVPPTPTPVPPTPTPVPPTPTPVPPTPTPVPTATPIPPTPTPVPQPTAPGLPGVGDDSIPVIAHVALLAAAILLGTGGVVMLRGHRARIRD